MNKPVMHLVSDAPDKLGAARRLIEDYMLLPDGWEWHGQPPLALPDFLAEELARLPTPAEPPAGDIVLAATDETAVAVGMIVAIDSESCEFKRVFVVEAHRGAGVAGRLVAAMEHRAQGLGYRRVIIDVLPERDAAVRFWQKRGFVACEPIREEPVPMLFFERSLAGGGDQR
ncbi:MAG: GNAT family N-acetyltransferase [Acidimicrobiales bacterium]